MTEKTLKSKSSPAAVRAVSLLLAAAALFCCTACGVKDDGRRSFSLFDLFDTVITVTVFTHDDAEFMEAREIVEETFTHYHRLFDIYNEYEGITNLAVINRMAGEETAADGDIIELILLGKEYERLTEGAVNIAMGSVLRLWHDCRIMAQSDPDNAHIPSEDALFEASLHCDINSVKVDEQKGTVLLEDPMMSLDVGAIAKGYAADKAAKRLKSLGLCFLINCGGAVLAGEKPDGSPWTAGITDPMGKGEYAAIVQLKNDALSTSGSYLRSFTVGGIDYGHIIDPMTLKPADKLASVSVVCGMEGSACLADALSTACFILGADKAESMLKASGASALFISLSGEQRITEGFPLNE